LKRPVVFTSVAPPFWTSIEFIIVQENMSCSALERAEAVAPPYLAIPATWLKKFLIQLHSLSTTPPPLC